LAFFTYIMASRRNGTLYTGSTDGIGLRASQHKEGAGSKFTARYEVERLVWFEAHETREARLSTGAADQEVEPPLETAAD